jgi:hypothetical protein
MDPANQNKAGRTTQQLDDVIRMAEGPQKVLYLLPTESSIPYAINLFVIRLGKLAPRREFYVRKSEAIVFPKHESWVHFTFVNQFPDLLLPDYALRGSVILDHACEETYPKASARWLDYCRVYAVDHPRPY